MIKVCFWGFRNLGILTLCCYFVLQENVKYLPGVKLGKNVVADPDLVNAGRHQYLDKYSIQITIIDYLEYIYKC